MISINVVYNIRKIILLCYVMVCPVVCSYVLLNSSYDVSRELFTEINANFIAYWKTIHPEDTLLIRQSHAGSTRQAISVLQGLRADVVTYNQVVDVQILHDRNQLIPKNWRNRLPNDSSPFFSTMSFLVRKGNPKKIYNWQDLTQDGLKIVFPNPKTSGNGRYTYLAAWYAFFQSSGKNLECTRNKMQKFLENVIVFDTGGRSATATFIERDQGDVLINFESESRYIQNRYNLKFYEIIIPSPNVLVEFPVTWIDKNVSKNGTQNVAKAYLQYLYTADARKIISKFGYRIDIKDFEKLENNIFSTVQLFKIEHQYGDDWNNIMKIHFYRGGELDKLLSSIGKSK